MGLKPETLMPISATRIIVSLFWLGCAALPVSADPTEANCPGLQGDALQRCLQGELRAAGPPAVAFFDAKGKATAIDKAVVTRSMTEVCRTIGRDGLFTAYRNDGDRRRGRKWKEVECRSGRLEGLWKEYFPSDDTLTVMSYDASGRAVKQAFYYQGRLIRENTLTLK